MLKIRATEFDALRKKKGKKNNFPIPLLEVMSKKLKRLKTRNDFYMKMKLFSNINDVYKFNI